MIKEIFVDFMCSSNVRVALVKFVLTEVRGTQQRIIVVNIDSEHYLRFSILQNQEYVRVGIFDRQRRLDNGINIIDETPILKAIDEASTRYALSLTGRWKAPDVQMLSMWGAVIAIPVLRIELTTKQLLELYWDYIGLYEKSDWVSALDSLKLQFKTDDVNLVANYIYTKLL